MDKGVGQGGGRRVAVLCGEREQSWFVRWRTGKCYFRVHTWQSVTVHVGSVERRQWCFQDTVYGGTPATTLGDDGKPSVQEIT